MTTSYVSHGTDAAGLIEAEEPFSRLDHYSRFEGRYEAMQNLLIEGACSGEIDCRGMLVVAEGGSVTAKVTARDIRVAGVIDGDLECSGRFELLPSGRASGTVRARQIIVHEGARYDGELQMTSGAAAEAEPADWQSAPVGEPSAAPEPAAPRRRSRAVASRDEPVVGEESDGLPESPDEDLPDFLRPRRPD